MQNKFGLKDFIFFVLLLVIGISVWFAMVQEDMRWRDVNALSTQVNQIEQQLAQMRRSMEQGGAVRMPGNSTPAAAPDADTSWARPGVPINQQPPFQVTHDPRDADDYRMGGEFTEIFEAQPPTISALTYKDVYARRVHDEVVEYLGRFHPETLELEGVLAAAWQYDPNGQWLRVRLRDRIRFSDGQPVTADDVVYTYELMFNPQIEADRFRSMYDMITGVEAIDERTVEFTFKDPMFVNLQSGLVFPVLPKHFYEQFTPTQINQSTGLLMGSGPFRVRDLDPNDQWAPGKDVVLERNEQYWGPPPVLERLRYKIVSDNLARLTAYNNGEGDMMRPSDPQFVEMKSRPEWVEQHDPLQWYNIRGGYSFIAWNTGPRDGRPSIFADKRIRRAMTHMIDREWYIRNVLEGNGTVCTGPFNPATKQANPDIEPLPYSLDRSRELLAEAGWTQDGRFMVNERGDTFTFEFTYSAGSDAADKLANYLRDQCARLGIVCELRKVDWSVYREILNGRDFDALTMAWSPSTPEGDPNQLWHSSQAAQGDNFTQWRNDEADRLIEAGRRELDDEKRMEIWHELHALIHEEQPYTFLVNRPWLRFVNRRIGNVHPYRTGLSLREFMVRESSTATSF